MIVVYEARENNHSAKRGGKELARATASSGSWGSGPGTHQGDSSAAERKPVWFVAVAGGALLRVPTRMSSRVLAALSHEPPRRTRSVPLVGPGEVARKTVPGTLFTPWNLFHSGTFLHS